MFKGQFNSQKGYINKNGIFVPTTPKLITPNTLCDEGGASFLKMIFQGNVADVALGGNFYVGLCGLTIGAGDPLSSDQLTDLPSEPTAAGGYARQAVARNSTGFPTVSKVNDLYRVQSATINFTASGADFSTPIYRLFICNVASGTSGLLFAYSAPLQTAETITDGNTYAVNYEFYFG